MSKEWIHKGYKSIKEIVNERESKLSFNNLSNPYYIKNADEMAQILANLKCDPYMPITIVGDYDTDGVCATAEMVIALNSIGCRNITTRLPKRMSEGYGLKETIVDEINEGVLITVDNGITASPAIQKAKGKGLATYIIDHHLPAVSGDKMLIPSADLIVDPNADGDSEPRFREWCAAGLVYRIAQKFVSDNRTLMAMSIMAMIATIADVVNLNGDNSRIYKEGQESIGNGYGTSGTRALIDFLHTDGHVDEADIGFKIGPMLNAPGRIYDNGAEKSLNLLLCEDPGEAINMVKSLNEDNEFRKRLKDRAMLSANEIIEQKNLAHTNPIIIVDDQIPEGIVGLTAGDIKEKYNVSSVVLTKSGNIYKGSGRASDYDNLKKALDKVNEADPAIFLGYGGHKMAAGVTIRDGKINDFIRLMVKFMEPARTADDYISYDLEVSPGELTNTAAELEQYRPFGQGNEEIVFRVNGLKLTPSGNSFYQKIGMDSVKLRGAGCEAIGFSMLPEYITIGCPTEVDLVGTLSFHYFRGEKTPQIEIMDMKTSEPQDMQNALNSELMRMIQESSIASRI